MTSANCAICAFKWFKDFQCFWMILGSFLERNLALFPGTSWPVLTIEDLFARDQAYTPCQLPGPRDSCKTWKSPKNALKKTLQKHPKNSSFSLRKKQTEMKKSEKNMLLTYGASKSSSFPGTSRTPQKPISPKSTKITKKTRKNAKIERFLVFLRLQIEHLLDRFTCCLRATCVHASNIPPICSFPRSGS